MGAGVEIVTLGQYLQPSKRHMKVHRYVHPDEFEHWKKVGEGLGFAYVASGPMVRSSYRAGEFFLESLLKERRAARAGTDTPTTSGIVDKTEVFVTMADGSGAGDPEPARPHRVVQQ